MKTRADAVIIGGGVGGCSIAYHLAKLGMSNVVLVEQYDLTSGTTWHSAGLVGQLRSTLSLTKMMMYSVDLYAELARETGSDPGWHEVGGLRLATTNERLEELTRQAGWARTFGLPLELIGPNECSELFPPLNTEDIVGAAYLPRDGYLDPSQLTFALAQGARIYGAEINTRTRVTEIVLSNGRVSGVETDKGPIETEIVVCAAGMYTPEISRSLGVSVPIVPVLHQYLMTEPFDSPLPALPTIRDPDQIVYFRTEVGGLLMGGYERNPTTWALEGIPKGFETSLVPEDWSRFDEIMTNGVNRVPVMETAPIKKFFNGPEGFTPDGEFVLGESTVPGFWVAAGFCVHGLAGAGGVGKIMAEWIIDGEPEYDVWHMDIRRFGEQYRSRRHVATSSLEYLGRYYDIRYPGEERQTNRRLRLSPTYPILANLGAAFGEKAGWERANWFETNALAGRESLRPEGWAGKYWSPAIDAECLAVRDTAALFDQSSFSKIEVAGPGATRFLDFLCTNRIDRPIGSVIYTQMLNHRGGIEADLTVTRLGEDLYRLVTGTAFGPHDLGWIDRHSPRDGRVHTRDVTGSLATLCLWGPATREILQPLTDVNLDDTSIPYMTGKQLTVGNVPVFAARVSYVGEFGYELYCSMEYAAELWRTVFEAGREHQVRPGGYRAIDSLRLEKGFVAWGTDVTSETTPDEAGLAFSIDLSKEQAFLGAEALLSQREKGDGLKLVTLVVSGESPCLGSEPVRFDEEVEGRVTSGGFGYRVGNNIAYAYVPIERAVTGNIAQVELSGAWIEAEVASRALYDPANQRLRNRSVER